MISKETSELIKREEFEAESKVVREVELDVVMDLATSIQIRNWLEDKINKLQHLINEAGTEKR